MVIWPATSAHPPVRSGRPMAPIYPLLIPCHRVLAVGGALGGYSGGDGPSTKLWLLNHECRLRSDQAAADQSELPSPCPGPASEEPPPMNNAIRVHEYGGPEALVWEEVPLPLEAR